MIKKRKKKSKIYFGTPVHDAIIKYNHSDDIEFRHKIYTEEIHAAFLKLAENIINTYKFMYFDYGFRDLQEEVVSNLVINMHKFDETKGSKAFSYFSVVAKNYLILNNINKKSRNDVDFVKRKDFSRITLTLKCLNNSKSIFLWAPGRAKSNIVKKILLDKKFKYPASFLKEKNNFLLYCN